MTNLKKLIHHDSPAAVFGCRLPDVKACEAVLAARGFERDDRWFYWTKAYVGRSGWGRVVVRFAQCGTEVDQLTVIARRVSMERPEQNSVRLGWTCAALDAGALGEVLDVVSRFYSREP